MVKRNICEICFQSNSERKREKNNERKRQKDRTERRDRKTGHLIVTLSSMFLSTSPSPAPSTQPDSFIEGSFHIYISHFHLYRLHFLFNPAAFLKVALPHVFPYPLYPLRLRLKLILCIQGGPHEHQIAAVATQLKEAMTPEFKTYIQQVKKNAQALAAALMARGHVLATGGTENHLLLWDLRPHGVTGSKMEKLCDAIHVTLNKNAIYGALAGWGVWLVVL